MSFIISIAQAARENTFFRKVLYTGQKSQVVVMAIPIGGDVGAEVHTHVEQTLVLVEGQAQSVLGDEVREVYAGDLVVVPPGIMHNFINNGTVPLKLYTVYAPVNHIDGRIHITKEDAEKDVEDEAVGERYTS